MTRRVPLGAVLIRFLPGWSGERGEVLVPEVIGRALIEGGYAEAVADPLTSEIDRRIHAYTKRDRRVLDAPDGP